MVLEAGSPRSRCSQIQYLVRAYFLVHRFIFWLCAHMAEGTRELSWAAFIRALIPFMRAPRLWPNHLQRLHLLTPLTWSYWIQILASFHDRLSVFKQHKFIFSEFWSLESPRSRCQLGWFVARLFSLACRPIFSPCFPLIFSSVHVCP